MHWHEPCISHERLTYMHGVPLQGLRWYGQRIPACWAKLDDAVKTMAKQGRHVLQWNECVAPPHSRRKLANRILVTITPLR
jgi:hypothetical protein